jgi:DNA-binding response OmpR family regulator
MASILVIDDDENIAEAVETWLVFMGHQVHLAFSGSEGLEWLEAHDCDLVLLDQTLSDLEGTEVCRHIRSMGKNMAVLMVSGVRGEEFRKSGLEAGATGFLPKPFDVEALQRTVEDTLAASPHPRRS